jgi:hypothetical protein
MSALAPASPRLARPARLLPLLVLGAVVVGLAAAQLALSGKVMFVVAFWVVLVPIAVWKRPTVAPVLVMTAALTIEQFPDLGNSRLIGLTAHIPLFHGLGGFRPSDLLLVYLLAVYVARRGTAAVADAPSTPLARGIQALFAAVAFGILFGVGTGGVARVALTEARPFLYLVLAYLAVSTMATTAQAVHSVLWAMVLGSGFKAVQGLLLFLQVHHQVPRPEAVLGHEESLFFGLFVFLTLGLWLYDVRGRLRTTATYLLPIVFAGDLANGRRTAWLVLPVGLIVAIAVGAVSVPAKRRFLGRLALVLLVCGAVYFPLFWNKSGGFAQPARAFHSAVSPDPRDASSNLYRVQEDENLKFNVAMAPPLGRGFGHPIDYALPIVDIRDIDPYIVYIPHNGVWWVFLRLGPLGAAAFWAVIGLGTLAGARLAKTARGELAAVGLLLACAMPGYALLGYNDQGFFYYRVGFVIGALLGLAEAARRLNLIPSVAGVAPVRVTSAPATRAVRPKQRVKRAAPSVPAFARGRDRQRVVALVGLLVAVALLLWVILSPRPTVSSGVRVPVASEALR